MRAHVTAQDAHARLLEELNEEKASALRRIGTRLEDLAQEARLRREALTGGNVRDPIEVARAREDFCRARAEALRHLWYLEVQREALGIRNHRRLDEFYPVPPPLDP